MSTSYSTNLALALPATGELSGTWGTTVNTNITNMLDEALGYQAYSATGGADTITIPDGTTGVARSIYIQLNGTGGGSVAVPATKTKMYFVFNNTSSAITFKVTGQTGVSIPAAAKMALVSNGTDVIVAQNYFAALTLGAALPVASGGTGLTAGTSGGVLAYTATGTLASSTALAANALVIGGGAGAAPSTTTTGTGVVTALGVNTGTAGAFVVNGGALGSPSSVGTMPAFTLGGTIAGGGNQINNVIIGTTGAAAGNFTTVNTSGIITITIPGTGIPTNLAVNTTAGAANGMSIEARADESSGIRLVQTSTTYNTSPVGASDPPNIASAGTLVSGRGGGLNIVGANGPVRTYSGGAGTATTSVSSTGLAITGTLSATQGGTQTPTFTSTVNGSLVETILVGKNSTGTARQVNFGINRFADDVWSLSNGTTEYLRGSLTSGGLAVTGTLEVSEAGTGGGLGGITAATATAGGNAGYLFRTGGSNRWSLSVVGSAGVEALRFYDVNNSSTRMTLDSSGNLLVGTASPNGKLTVASGATTFVAGLTSTGTNTYTATAATSLTNSTLQLSGGNASGATTGIRMSQSSNFELFFGGVQEAGGAGSFVWQGYNGSAYTERMRLDSSGNLGLGVTPSAFGSTYKAFQPNGYAAYVGDGNNGRAEILNNAYASANNVFNYYDTNSAGRYSLQLGVHAWYNAASGTAGNAISFGDPKMTLTALGELLVGDTSPTGSAKLCVAYNGNSFNGLALNDTASVSSAGYSYFQIGGTTIGSITRVGATSAVIYNTTSDYRLKTVTGAVTGQGARIDALKPIDYIWIEGGQQARGFLAHEFQAVYSNSVTGDKDAVDANGNPKHQSMQASTSEVIADLVAELQSLRARVAQLESKP